MTTEEFLSSYNHEEVDSNKDDKEPNKINTLMNFSLKFDPYSPTAEEDYHSLVEEVKKFDILDLLKTELAKSRINRATASKIIQSIKFLSEAQKEAALISLMSNLEVLYPVFSSVMQVAYSMFDEVSEDTKCSICSKIRELINSESYLISTDNNLVYSIRVLSLFHREENTQILTKVFNTSGSFFVRGNVILAMAKFNNYEWISNIRNRFNTLTSWERRSFIISSFILGDEGSHWRKRVKKEFNDFEELVCSWTSENKDKKGKNWSIPL